MSTLVLRNVPADLHAMLKAQARRNHRSLNREAVSLIEKALLGHRAATELPPPISLEGGPLTTADIEHAIAAGRD
jgi:plasmid stability protein